MKRGSKFKLGKRRVAEIVGNDLFLQTVDGYIKNMIPHINVLLSKRVRIPLSDHELLVGMVNRHAALTREKDAPPLNDDELKIGLRLLARRWKNKRVKPAQMCEPLCTNLEVLSDVLGFDSVERQVVQFVFLNLHYFPFRSVTDFFENMTHDGAAHIVAIAIGVPQLLVSDALQPRGRLVGSGIVDVNDEICDLDDKFTLDSRVIELLLSPSVDRQKVMDRFLPTARAASLVRDDFDHLREEVTTTLDLLRVTVRERREGVNVLLYGPTGTGKSELARYLAAGIGASLYVTGRDDEEGKGESSYERLTSLQLGNRLVGKTNALLVFDEMEDLFTWNFDGRNSSKRGTSRMSKLWFNELLETNAAPTIWISNSVRGVDPAFLRRFSYAIEVPALGVRQRSRVLKRHLGEPPPLSDADVDVIAQRYDTSPAQLGAAVATAKALAGEKPLSRDGIERVLAPIVKLVSGDDASRVRVFNAGGYDVDALNSPDDLIGIADQLALWKPSEGLGVSLCLYGPPGVGKSEYVKYVAHRMGRRVLYKRVSDLQSPFLGVCEQNIAAAFREAEKDDAVLLFDEADSFLRDRREAVRSWEVSQVNEFLQQLESFRGVVACTTNLFDELDQASLRRFVFKVRFDYLKPEQAVRMLRTITGGDVADDVLKRLNRMPPLAFGDFAAVQRRLRALGKTATVDEALGLLRDEALVRDDEPRRVGFAA